MGDWREIVLGKLGQTFSGLSGKSKEDFGSGKPYIPYMNIFSNVKINPNDLELVEIEGTERQNKVQYGDIFFTTSSETLKEVGMTSVLLNDLGEAYLNSFCFGFRLLDFDTLLPEFAAYLLRSESVRHQISFNGQGSTRYNLSKTQLLKNVVLKIPTKQEQSTIATILTTIDQAIEKTEQLIAKYELIKTGLMQDLLTRGIDEQGNIRSEETHEFKDSPLGRIPKEWEVKELLEVSTLVTNGFVGVATPFYSNPSQGVPYLYGNNIRKNKVDLNVVTYVNKEFHAKHKKSQLIPGDMLTVQSGHIGTTAIVPESLCESNCHALIITKFKKGILEPNFVSLFFNFCLDTGAMSHLFVGSTIKHINTSDLAKFLLPFPSKDEQVLIIQTVASLESSLSLFQSELENLHLIKNGLMQDLLTGKVRVDALMNQVTQPI